MLALEVHRMSVGGAAEAPVLNDVTLGLGPGFHGLVGPNGAGKTTLLRAIAGELAPWQGIRRIAPEDASVVLCHQEVELESDDVADFAFDPGKFAERWRRKLALDPVAIARWSTLSPGERKRWQIGAALSREPDVLLLDEPTNHLDRRGTELLVQALVGHRGIGLVVSHDRGLLDALATTIVRVHDGTVTTYAGNYTAARAAWDLERQSRQDARALAKKRLRAEEQKLEAARAAQAAAARSKSASVRMRNHYDNDGRGALAKGMAAFADARAGRTVAVVKSQVARAAAAVPTAERDRTLGGNVFATFERAPSPVLFHVDEEEVRASEASSSPVVLRDVRLTVRREDRLRIAGDNGAGKSTLLARLLASNPGARALYLPQEFDQRASRALALRVAREPVEARGHVLSIFAALGGDPRIVTRQDGAMSPGEARKLALADALARQVWALVLDEPTNHLDLPSVERLESVLSEYPGCVVLVTHDDALAERTTRRTVVVERGSVR